MLSLVSCFLFITYVASAPNPLTIDDIRIVGGEDIDITDAPYQVSIARSGRHICGGSIVQKDIIVTAAHCVINTTPLLYTIRVGSAYSNKGGLLYRVSGLAWHPDFNFHKYDSDVAILKLSRPLTLNSRVAIIEMAPEYQEVSDGDMTTVTGWGATQENGGPPKILQRVQVPKVNDIECGDRYKPQYNITARMLCAGIPVGGKDACQGDSGGPLTYQNKLSGIVSWGIGCARPDYPGVYAKVSALRNWIDTNIAKLRLKQFDDLFIPIV